MLCATLYCCESPYLHYSYEGKGVWRSGCGTMGQKTNSTMRGGAVDAEKSQCGCGKLADSSRMTIQNEKYNSGELR